MSQRKTSLSFTSLLGIQIEDEIETMISLHKTNFTEEAMRNGFLAFLAVIGSFYFNFTFPIFWILCYISCSIWMRLSLNSLRDTRSHRSFKSVLLALTARLTSYRVMLLFLWVFPHPAAHYLAIFMLLAALSYSVNFKSRARSYMAIHTVLDVVVLLIIATDFLLFNDALEGAFLITIAAVCLVIFLLAMLKQHFVFLDALEETETQHRQAQKMEAVGRLTGGVAHDFNNILTVILGNLELHKETKDPKDREDLLETTRLAATRAADLTTQLLAFSRKSTLKLDVVNIRKVFEQMHPLTERLLPANITLNSKVQPNTPNVRTDETQLEVALINLVINARDAMERGGTVDLIARFKTIDADQKVVQISLTDQGGGIPDELMDKVAEPFFTTKQVGKGSGMGLPMVKGFAEQSGGYLEIDTVPGVSTTVSIFLPADQASPA